MSLFGKIGNWKRELTGFFHPWKMHAYMDKIKILTYIVKSFYYLSCLSSWGIIILHPKSMVSAYISNPFFHLIVNWTGDLSIFVAGFIALVKSRLEFMIVSQFYKLANYTEQCIVIRSWTIWVYFNSKNSHYFCGYDSTHEFSLIVQTALAVSNSLKGTEGMAAP